MKISFFSSWQFTHQQSAVALLLIVMLRMFGLFVAIPVISVHAVALINLGSWHNDLPASPFTSGFWLGIVMGGYGLMQFLMQVPAGWASDRFGRRPIIAYGLLLFALGAMLCEISRSVEGLALGRLLQGLGTVSAASTALLSDLTPSSTRVRWMAGMGAGISLAFIGAFIAGPKLYGILQFQGFFLIPAYLSIFSLFLLAFFADPHPLPANNQKNANPILDVQSSPPPLTFSKLWHDPTLMALNLGVFFLHASMVSVFVALPWILRETLQMSTENQWRFYAWIIPPALIGAFLFIWRIQKNLRPPLDSPSIARALPTPPLLIFMVMLLLICLTVMSLWLSSSWVIFLGMAGYFLAFNILEALQPSLVSFYAPPASKGLAMGAYHASQSLGLFIGGLAGGWIFRLLDASAVLRLNAALMALWLSFMLYRHFHLDES